MAALTSLQGRGLGKPGAFGESIGGECGKDVWVKSVRIAPLSQSFSSRLTSLLEISIDTISLG